MCLVIDVKMTYVCSSPKGSQKLTHLLGMEIIYTDSVQFISGNSAGA